MPDNPSHAGKKASQHRDAGKDKGETRSNETADGESSAAETAVATAPSAFDRHVAYLTDPRMSHPTTAQERSLAVRQIQRDYGNRYVQRV